MALARIEAGELQLKKHRTSIKQILLLALKRAEPRTRLHRIHLEASEHSPPVNVDEPALVEVLYALLDNAAKYSSPGSLISVTASAGIGPEVLLIVEDEGPGIPLELRERVFAKFFRSTDESGQDKPAGTGMGLAIAQGIVEAHGGRIWIEDRAWGKGARIIVALPGEFTCANEANGRAVHPKSW